MGEAVSDSAAASWIVSYSTLIEQANIQIIYLPHKKSLAKTTWNSETAGSYEVFLTQT